MPYNVSVTRIEGCCVELLVTPEQPDAEPFAMDRGFGVGLLLGAAHSLQYDEARDCNQRVPTGPLGEVLDAEAIDELAVGAGEPERFVMSVTVVDVEPWPWQYGQLSPAATYRIEVSDPQWLQHLVEGAEFVSYAYSEEGPFFD